MQPFQKNYFLYIKQKNLLYCAIPKNACTSVKSWVQGLLELPDDVNPQVDPNINGLLLNRYSDQEIDEIVNSREVFKFVFVRNPWSRVVSAFLNKFFSFQQHLYVYMREQEAPSLKDFVAGYHEKFVADVVRVICPDDAALVRGASFRDFLGYLLGTDDTDLDPHWKPQHCFIEGVAMDFVGKVESIENDFRRVQEVAGFYLGLPLKNTTRYATTNSVQLSHVPCSELIGKTFDISNFLTTETIEIVRQRYTRDIEIFGYTSP